MTGAASSGRRSRLEYGHFWIRPGNRKPPSFDDTQNHLLPPPTNADPHGWNSSLSLSPAIEPCYWFCLATERTSLLIDFVYVSRVRVFFFPQEHAEEVLSTLQREHARSQQKMSALLESRAKNVGDLRHQLEEQIDSLKSQLEASQVTPARKTFAKL